MPPGELVVQMLAKQTVYDKLPVSLRVDVDTMAQAKRQVELHVKTGWRELSAEIIDPDGEVVGYYERGSWTRDG